MSFVRAKISKRWSWWTDCSSEQIKCQMKCRMNQTSYSKKAASCSRCLSYRVHNSHTPLHEECPKHHSHNGEPEVTLKICGAVGGRAKVSLMCVNVSGVEIAFYPQWLGITRVRSWAMNNLCHLDSRMLKNTSIKGVKYGNLTGALSQDNL
jgi:hypothetical protein